MNMANIVWRPGDQKTKPPPPLEGGVYRLNILEVIEKTIDELSPALRSLSQDILGMPSCLTFALVHICCYRAP